MQQRMRVVRILWGALLASTFMYLVVLAFATVPQAQAVPALPPALGASSVVLAVLSFALPRQQAKSALSRQKFAIADVPEGAESDVLPYREAGKTRKEFAEPERAELAAFPAYQTGLILGSALCEAIATFGFVLGYLRFPPWVFLPFFALAWVLFLLRFPTRAKLRRLLEDAKGAHFPR
ncbi:MAG: hypothetical protein U0263_29060 [Polyangiaceae bacterium]